MFEEWIARCREQMTAALSELEAFRVTDWPKRNRLMQPEITTVCMLAYVRRVEPHAVSVGSYPNLEYLSRECEATSAFRACPEIAGTSGRPA